MMVFMDSRRRVQKDPAYRTFFGGFRSGT